MITMCNNCSSQLKSRSMYKLARLFATSVTVIIIAVAICILFIQSWQCFDKYREKGMIVREQVRSTSEGANDITMPFIAFIVCPIWDFAYKNDILKDYGLTQEIYRRKGSWSPNNDINATSDLREVYDKITYQLHEILRKITFHTTDVKHDEIRHEFSAERNDSGVLRVVKKYKDSLGTCYSIRPKDRVVKLGIFKVDFVAQFGLYVYLVHPGQFKYMAKTKVTSRSGERVYVDFIHELTRNKIGHLEDHKCDPMLNYNYDRQWHQQLAEQNENTLGCSVPWHPTLISRRTKKKIKICENSTLGMKAKKQFDRFADGVSSMDQIPCATYQIFPGFTDRDVSGNKPNEAYIRLYLNTKIRVKSMVLHYDSTTFGAEIGGLIGMLLGMSLVDIALKSNSYVLKMAKKLFH